MTTRKFKSSTIKLYDCNGLTAEQITLVDDIYEWAEDHYENGGDSIVECMTPAEIIDSYDSLDAAQRAIGLWYGLGEEIKSTVW